MYWNTTYFTKDISLLNLKFLSILTYLFFRYTQLKTIEDERRAYELKMKPIWDAEKAAAKEAANRESMLSLAAAAGVKVIMD